MHLIVDPASRRQGGGRELLTETIKHLSSDGAELLKLTVKITNGPAIALYRGIGFKDLQTIAAYKSPVVRL